MKPNKKKNDGKGYLERWWCWQRLMWQGWRRRRNWLFAVACSAVFLSLSPLFYSLLCCFFFFFFYFALSPFSSAFFSLSLPSLLFPLSFFLLLLPLPCFYRQKQGGGATWWGDHCWPPLHYPLIHALIHGKRGKWVSLFGVFLKGGGVLLKENMAVNRRRKITLLPLLRCVSRGRRWWCRSKRHRFAFSFFFF